MNTKQYFVYIMTNKINTTLYTGVTNNLSRRVFEHKNKLVEGFTKKYNLDKLVYYELYTDIYEAIGREKQIKSGSRAKKIKLIKAMNPKWKDLYDGIWDRFVISLPAMTPLLSLQETQWRSNLRDRHGGIHRLAMTPHMSLRITPWRDEAI